jgi:hypothetical protein
MLLNFHQRLFQYIPRPPGTLEPDQLNRKGDNWFRTSVGLTGALSPSERIGRIL